MSIKSAKLYVERMKTDEAFKDRIFACKDAKARKKFVKAERFDFSHDDIKAVTAELDDDELKELCGGRKNVEILNLCQ